jgi:hypothetical protein
MADAMWNSVERPETLSSEGRLLSAEKLGQALAGGQLSPAPSR